MDEKLREYLREILKMAQEDTASKGSIPFKDFWADQISTYLHRQGYRKVEPEKLPMLDNKELKAIAIKELGTNDGFRPLFPRRGEVIQMVIEATAEAQRADMLRRLEIEEG